MTFKRNLDKSMVKAFSSIAGIFLAARQICAGWEFTRDLIGNDEQQSHHALEKRKSKKQYADFELAGKTLALLGLAVIGGVLLISMICSPFFTLHLPLNDKTQR